MSSAQSDPPTASALIIVRLLAVALGLGALAVAVFTVDRVGAMLPPHNTSEIQEPLRTFEAGSAVLLGNSVAKSAIKIDDLRAELGEPSMVELTLHGAAPTTWYVIFQHYLAEVGRAPRLLVLVSSRAGLTRTIPVEDRDSALELARYNDPVLASLLGITPERLGWERRFAARLRVRDALVQVLAKPLARRVAGPERAIPGDVRDELDRAVETTLGQSAFTDLMHGGPLVQAQHEQRETAPELEPAVVSLLAATEAAGTRVVVVVLPQRQGGPEVVTSAQVEAALGPHAQMVDMTPAPFEWADFVRDNQHFSPKMLDALSHAIAFDVSVLLMRRSARVLEITERPAP